MKRKTICIAALGLWFLAFSTIFAFWVEEVMVPFATTTQPVQSANSLKASIPLDCLAEDAEGNPVLYQTSEGTGWEEGCRAALVNPRYYTVELDEISIEYADSEIIRYASKPLRAGKPVNIIQRPQERPDTLVVICPDGLPPIKEDAACQILGQTGQALLVSTHKSAVPFLPKQAAASLFEPEALLSADKSVYSLTELREFANALPLLALIHGLVLTVLILWLYSWPLAKSARQNKKALLANGAFAAASLCAFSFVLNWTALPSSLLPTRNIVDVSHYVREFSEIFSTLQAFSNAPAAACLSHIRSMFWLALGLISFCALLGVAVVLLERRFWRKRVV